MEKSQSKIWICLLCHVSHLQFGDSRKFCSSSVGIIKKPGSPSHFHLPPSASPPSSPQLHCADPGRGHMQSDWLSAKSPAIMHISSEPAAGVEGEGTEGGGL